MSAIDRFDCTLFGKIWFKNQNCQFKVKSDTENNLNMQNSIVIFTFSVSDQKYHFRKNLVTKFMIF